MTARSLLSGPDPSAGMETAAAHLSRLGPLPVPTLGLLDVLERSDLRGRGGAAFPVARKWRAVAERRGPRPVVLVNGAEGEPLSHKDRVLMAARPHLVLDGAALAAGCTGADEVVLYVGSDHSAAAGALRRALAERPDPERRRTRIVEAPARYVAGEETAAVHCVNDGVALPTSTPPRPYERGIGGRPTLVQNVESLAHVAMVDAAALRAAGHTLGCGVVAVLPEQRCGVVETARIMAYLAEQSARQCGPCVFGLRAIAAATDRLAAGAAEPDDLERLRRWSGELRGRGACHHPDGAAGLLLSALRVFAGDFVHHHRHGGCAVVAARAA